MWAVTDSGIDPQATGARGAGLATVVSGAAGPGGTVLDTWFPAPELVPASQPSGTVGLSLAEAVEALGPDVAPLLGPDEARGVEVVAVLTTIGRLSAPPADGHENDRVTLPLPQQSGVTRSRGTGPASRAAA